MDEGVDVSPCCSPHGQSALHPLSLPLAAPAWLRSPAARGVGRLSSPAGPYLHSAAWRPCAVPGRGARLPRSWAPQTRYEVSGQRSRQSSSERPSAQVGQGGLELLRPDVEEAVLVGADLVDRKSAV